MTRTKARELAIRLIYAQAASDEAPEDLLGGFFEEEHFETLAGEDALFGEKPDEGSLAYIRGLVSLCAEHRAEIDAYIEKYAIGWRTERIRARRRPFCAARWRSCSTWRTRPPRRR